MKFIQKSLSSIGLASVFISFSAFAAVTSTTYQYDDLGRATKVEVLNNALTTYVYDLADNRTGKTLLIDPCSFPNAQLSDMTVDRVSSASYKTSSSGCVQILNAAGTYVNAGRWLAPGLNANNYSVRAISTSTIACAGGYMGVWLPSYYISGWSISSPGTYQTGACSFRLEISLSNNTSVILGTANINLRAPSK